MRQYKSGAPMIGEIYLMEFEGRDCEQRGVRPGLIFQNNTGNEYSPNVIALPLTTAIKKVGLPTHVLLRADEAGLQYDSLVLCESPQHMCKSRILQYITRLTDEQMAEVAVASLLASSAISFVNIDCLVKAYNKAKKLNWSES